MQDTQNVVISNNHLSGYSTHSMFTVNRISNVVVSGNTFEVNADDVPYGIDAYEVGFVVDCVMFWFQECGNVEFTGNVFANNSVEINTPWVRFEESQNTTCLSGNRFCSEYMFSSHRCT